MNFWLVDVKSTVAVNGKDVCFDWINTHLSVDDAIKNAKIIALDKNTLQVSVHKWILKEDGTQDIASDEDSCMYNFLNDKHREWKV